MRKSGVFSSAIFLSIIIAGLYGILHDQITATISPEYYTKFKFQLFRVNENLPFRQGVAYVGFYATWWMGAAIGILLAIVAVIFPDHKSMKAAIIKALTLVFITTALSGLIGYVYGRAVLNPNTVNWWLPDDVLDKSSFIIVGAIHNAGYIGGLLGLVLGIVVLFYRRWKLKRY